MYVYDVEAACVGNLQCVYLLTLLKLVIRVQRYFELSMIFSS